MQRQIPASNICVQLKASGFHASRLATYPITQSRPLFSSTDCCFIIKCPLPGTFPDKQTKWVLMNLAMIGGRIGARGMYFLLALGTIPVLFGQTDATKSRRVSNAIFTDSIITIDGQLDEPAWQTAEVNADFLQQDPREGEPASEKTEVRVLFNHDFLYVSAICHDRTPSKIVNNDIRRDFDTLNQDYFTLLLDTFNDGHSGYYFATSPGGSQHDRQVSDEGRSSNTNWDGVWYAETQRGPDGYTVEMAIPFKTLRFNRDQQQTWGVHFYRRMRGRNESTYWSMPPRRYSLTRALSYAGELRGIEDVQPGHSLQIKPYAIAGVERLASRGKKADGDFDGGLDIKYGITPGMVLDVTGNTDFSHVESDTQQVNLTRFPLFFPEKREFFLENSGIFQFGALRRNEALLFHSRTIGLESGQPIPIFGGARLSGRQGNTSIGLLNMQTRSERNIPATNFSVARVRQNILGASDVGAIFLNRQSSLPNDTNHAFGVDQNLVFFRTDLRLSTLAARTDSPNLKGDDWIKKIEGEYQNNEIRFFSSYLDIGANFNPRMGFVQRRGRRIARNEFEWRIRQNADSKLGKWVRDWVPLVTSEYVVLSDGRTETKSLLMPFNLEFQDGSVLVVQHERRFERLTRPFDLPFAVPVLSGDFPYSQTAIGYHSDQSKPISGLVLYGWGNFYDGTIQTWNLNTILRSGYRLRATLDYERNHITMPRGEFTTNLVGSHIDWSFNPKMYLNTFFQYNNETDSINSNIRFRFIHRPLSDIYVVYNDVRDRRRELADSSLTIKYTHLFSF
ncbi:MAG: hypothetical protein EXQ56_03765 [Acidobacteria bacterium]|nr:hypothetical protein [Acidobacteriota bacterium]